MRVIAARVNFFNQPERIPAYRLPGRQIPERPRVMDKGTGKDQKKAKGTENLPGAALPLHGHDSAYEEKEGQGSEKDSCKRIES
jgi:hypothetical protein